MHFNPNYLERKVLLEWNEKLFIEPNTGKTETKDYFGPEGKN